MVHGCWGMGEMLVKERKVAVMKDDRLQIPNMQMEIR